MQQKIHVTEKWLEELDGLDYEKCAVNKGNAADLRTGIAIGSKAYELIVVTGDRKGSVACLSTQLETSFRE
ncbi:hypothetical protein [Peribacillus sp. FSL P2-0133]|uniref:hypothetical protein n=1 Tax=Peribacillus sp. FSL P2-0133 TaxID=2921573 RepID=UPI0030CD66A1